MVYLILAACLAAAYLLALRGRRNHPGMAELRTFRYAHRGLHDNTRPENSMAAFEAALENGYGVEFDLHLLKDGNLGVMHDSLLLRTTGQEGKMEDLTADDLKKYQLQGTDQTIPEFSQVLFLFAGKAPLIIELKSDGDNYAALTETVCRRLEGYQGPYCVESFDPRCVRWLKENRPEIIRGQLSENFVRRGSSAPWLLRFVMTHCLTNFWNRPDFIAYRFADRRNLSLFLCRKLWKLQGVSWTLKGREELEQAEKEKLIPIFEGFLPQ